MSTKDIICDLRLNCIILLQGLTQKKKKKMADLVHNGGTE